MNLFKRHKRDAERILETNPDLKDGLIKKQLEIIIELCEAGLKLERDTQELQKEIERLKKLEAELAELEKYAGDLQLMRQELEAENAALKRELAGEMEKY